MFIFWWLKSNIETYMEQLKISWIELFANLYNIFISFVF